MTHIMGLRGKSIEFYIALKVLSAYISSCSDGDDNALNKQEQNNDGDVLQQTTTINRQFTSSYPWHCCRTNGVEHPLDGSACAAEANEADEEEDYSEHDGADEESGNEAVELQRRIIHSRLVQDDSRRAKIYSL